MHEIKCPKCGEQFTIDEAGYTAIVEQVRNAEFEKEIASREKQIADSHKKSNEYELKLLEQAKEQEIADLRAQQDKAEKENQLAIQKVKDQYRDELDAKEKDISDLKAELQKKASESALERQEAEAKKDVIIADLKAKQDNAEKDKELAVEQAKNDLQKQLTEKDILISELKSKLQQKESDSALELQAVEAKKDTIIADLKSQKDNAEKDMKLAVEQTKSEMQKQITEKEHRITELQAEIKNKDTEARLLLSQEIQKVNEEKAQQKADYEAQIKAQEKEIEYYKDFKARLSTKMIGESLEQHCRIEFDRLRPTAFRFAYFDKDNDAREGTKGDFIYRDYDEHGTEFISIMFEMKNEADETSTKHKNEDFFKKLDSDRNKKGCEYAVLVSLLEADSEYYNAGIVDVSHIYPKMYVIRPQFFIPLITMLRNAAEHTLEARRELAIIQEQNIDITHFEEDLMEFKTGFSRNYELATRKFETAIEEIDKTITHLQKIKDNLLSSGNNLRLANDKAEGLTIKKLTRKNPTMKQKFDELNSQGEK